MALQQLTSIQHWAQPTKVLRRPPPCPGLARRRGAEWLGLLACGLPTSCCECRRRQVSPAAARPTQDPTRGRAPPEGSRCRVFHRPLCFQLRHLEPHPQSWLRAVFRTVWMCRSRAAPALAAGRRMPGMKTATQSHRPHCYATSQSRATQHCLISACRPRQRRQATWQSWRLQRHVHPGQCNLVRSR